MPVIETHQISQTLESVVIHLGGSVDVSIKVTAPGFPDNIKTFNIAESDALPFWGTNPTGLVNRWEDLCSLLYSILLNRGDITGTIT
jgi:hypothetical protein